MGSISRAREGVGPVRFLRPAGIRHIGGECDAPLQYHISITGVAQKWPMVEQAVGRGPVGRQMRPRDLAGLRR